MDTIKENLATHLSCLGLKGLRACLKLGAYLTKYGVHLQSQKLNSPQVEH